jgi:hypothetical protein
MKTLIIQDINTERGVDGEERKERTNRQMKKKRCSTRYE